MNHALEIEAEWELLEYGPPEERACFAAIGIRYGDRWLTEADDHLVKRVRTSVYLSAYQLAQWLAWNWWRLRWEPHSRSPEWEMAHRMTAIGGGYAWPNITIRSDGERIVVAARRSTPGSGDPVRYIADETAILRAVEFENATERFLEQAQEQLRIEGVPETNFDRIWNAVKAERADPEAAHWRRLEATLGFDPDDGNPALIDRLLADAKAIGQSAVQELAASHDPDHVPTTQALLDIARTHGFDARPGDAVLLSSARLPARGFAPAGKRGAEAARQLRDQESLSDEPISDARLAAMAGVSVAALTETKRTDDFAFSLDSPGGTGAVVLQSRFATGRRFELARLIGDRIVGGGNGGIDGTLLPATRAYTYRQQMQRAFAAELLCPYQSLEEMLGGALSDDAIEDAAAHFGVSPLTVRTMLVAHRRLDAYELDWDAASPHAA